MSLLKDATHALYYYSMQQQSLMKRMAPIVLRYSMAAVILWFSLQQFIHPDMWVAYVPDSAVNLTGFSAPLLVYANATFELIFGMFLIFGIYTRISAVFLALHLLDIMWVVGYGEIGVRDFGLALALMSVALNGADMLCAEYKEAQSLPVIQ